MLYLTQNNIFRCLKTVGGGIMERKAYFSEKLSSILFLEINKDKLMSLFKIHLSANMYMPIKSSKLIDEVSKSGTLEEISINHFIEGMFYVLGLDENFKYNSEYLEMMLGFPQAATIIKSIIFNEIKKENYEDAYVFLKGLLLIENSEDIYDKVLIIAENLRLKDKSFTEEELSIIDKAKNINNYALPYLYESIIKKERGDFSGSLYSINTYLSIGGKETVEITEFILTLKNITAFEEAKELLYENPDKALKLFIPLLEVYGDNASLYYNIAVTYRIMQNHEKAIYYLNEALAIDDALVEVVNELGINYASLGDYNTAIQYLRKAFEVTRSVEICTNLIMCYIDTGDFIQARNHLEIAKKIDSTDEIVLDLQKILEQNKI